MQCIQNKHHGPIPMVSIKYTKNRTRRVYKLCTLLFRNGNVCSLGLKVVVKLGVEAEWSSSHRQKL